MADISLCPGIGCPLRNSCRRYTAPASELNRWIRQPPIENGRCELYEPTTEPRGRDE